MDAPLVFIVFHAHKEFNESMSLWMWETIHGMELNAIRFVPEFEPNVEVFLPVCVDN